MEKLISTDALEGGKFHSIEDWAPIEASSWQRGWNDAIDAIISNVSTVDAPEVVRCKDCIHYYADPWGYGNCVFEGGVSRRTKTSDFCSWGERREDDES